MQFHQVIYCFQVAPWEEPISSVHENSWVMLEESINLGMNVDDDTLQIEMEEREWTSLAGESILKQWMNMLHRAALSRVDVRSLASQAVQLGEKVSV